MGYCFFWSGISVYSGGKYHFRDILDRSEEKIFSVFIDNHINWMGKPYKTGTI